MNSQILAALDLLVEYPDLQNYIKEYEKPRGLMFKMHNADACKSYEAQLENLLNGNGMHSGFSWICLLSGVQAVLNGVFTREELMAESRAAHQRYEAARQAADKKYNKL